MTEARARVFRAEREGHGWVDVGAGEDEQSRYERHQPIEAGLLTFLGGLDPADVYAVTETNGPGAGGQFITVYYRKRKEGVEDAAF